MILDDQVVLIVENEYVICQNLADLLEDHGFITLTATSIAEAYKILNSTSDLDLLITDIDLENALTGFDLAKSARKMYNNLPVIYVTGSAKKREDIKNSKYLSKPYEEKLLVETVKKMISTDQETVAIVSDLKK